VLFTGPDYGRIWDHELCLPRDEDCRQRSGGYALEGGRACLDWATMTHNPFVDVTKNTTTLYASDRDVFLFLVDDYQSDRGGTAAGWIAGFCISGFLLLE